MKSGALSLALAALCALLLSAGAGEGEAQYLRQDSPEGGYSMDLPLDWDVKTGLRGWDCVAFSPEREPGSPYIANISVAAADLKDVKSPAKAAEAFTAALKARSDSFSMLSEGEVSLAGCEGVKIEYLYEAEREKLKGRALFLSKDGSGKLWSLSFSGSLQSFARSKAAFDAAEASFKPR